LFIEKLKTYFIIISIFSIIIISYNIYKDYIFDTHSLSKDIIKQIKNKKINIMYKIQQKYNKIFDVPIIFSSKINNNLYGLTTYQNNKIQIILNKKRFKENKEYMIQDVLPHEYAHALMFKLNLFNQPNKGHSLKWQKICQDIGGIKCNRFVNYKDIITDKMKF
jgi:predicted SprT family Zn-dependent metalloprotease